MVILKYKLKDEGMFISCQDLQRIWRRILNISGIEITRKNNKNRDEMLFFLNRDELGVESLSEFIAFDCQYKSREVKDNILANLPSWIEVVASWDYLISSSPFINVVDAQYNLVLEGIEERKSDINEFFENIIDKTEKRHIHSIDVSSGSLIVLAADKLFAIDVSALLMRLLKYLNLENKDYKIVREEVYYSNGEGDIELLDKMFK